MKEAYSKMELWNSSLKKIGGNFGIGIVAYFLFIKWLMYLNLLLSVIIFLLIILPAIVLEIPEDVTCAHYTNSVKCCSAIYKNRTEESDLFHQFLTPLLPLFKLSFYSSYTHKVYVNADGSFSYDMPLSYICTIISVFIVSLLAIVRSAAKSFRERVVEGEGQFYRYCNLVFGGWDYCINNEKSASIKHKALYNEMKAFLESERLEEERRNRTSDEKAKLLIIRLFVNAVIIMLLIGCAMFVYYIINFSFTQLVDSPWPMMKDNIYYQWLCEFFPYLCIVGLNLTVPFVFRYLVTLEYYSPSYVVKMTLYRTMFFRFASLAVLLVSLHDFIAKVENESCLGFWDKYAQCWEKFVGYQFFKLYIVDLMIQFFVTFFINFPRSLIARHTENKFLRFVGEQEFDLPKHVLDILYSQTICWLGCFFIPVLPMFAVPGTHILFLIKKFTCLVNSKPSNKIYRASRLNCLFMFNLLICFILAVIPVGYSIAYIVPSKSCGPFRGSKSVWTLLIKTFCEFPNWLQSVLSFLGTATFGIPAFVVLSLLLYYYYVMWLANKHMVSVLKNQLVLEGHDKQFLLNRLSAFIKQQQDQNKFHQEQANELGTFQHV